VPICAGFARQPHGRGYGAGNQILWKAGAETVELLSDVKQIDKSQVHRRRQRWVGRELRPRFLRQAVDWKRDTGTLHIAAVATAFVLPALARYLVSNLCRRCCRCRTPSLTPSGAMLQTNERKAPRGETGAFLHVGQGPRAAVHPS
jgi:hypothetical protein